MLRSHVETATVCRDNLAALHEYVRDALADEAGDFIIDGVKGGGHLLRRNRLIPLRSD